MRINQCSLWCVSCVWCKFTFFVKSNRTRENALHGFIHSTQRNFTTVLKAGYGFLIFTDQTHSSTKQSSMKQFCNMNFSEIFSTQTQSVHVHCTSNVLINIHDTLQHHSSKVSNVGHQTFSSEKRVRSDCESRAWRPLARLCWKTNGSLIDSAHMTLAHSLSFALHSSRCGESMAWRHDLNSKTSKLQMFNLVKQKYLLTIYTSWKFLNCFMNFDNKFSMLVGERNRTVIWIISTNILINMWRK